MKRSFIIVFTAFLVSACNPHTSGPQLAAVNAEKQLNAALARDHKITYVEAARRDIAAVNARGEYNTDNGRLAMATRMALAAEVDAGRLTPEMAELQFQERVAELNSADQARRLEVSRALLATGAAMLAPPKPAINCTSTKLGLVVNTTCN